MPFLPATYLLRPPLGADVDQYHIWCDLIDNRRDRDFAAAVAAWLDALREAGHLASWRLSRRKLGLGPDGLGEFHIMIETDDLAQLDRAFQTAATRTAPWEALHQRVYALVRAPRFGLYRDFPDPAAPATPHA